MIEMASVAMVAFFAFLILGAERLTAIAFLAFVGFATAAVL